MLEDCPSSQNMYSHLATYHEKRILYIGGFKESFSEALHQAVVGLIERITSVVREAACFLQPDSHATDAITELSAAASTMFIKYSLWTNARDELNDLRTLSTMLC